MRLNSLLRQNRPLILSTLVLMALLCLPAQSSAQNASNYTVGLMLGLGGSIDAEPDTEFDDFGFEAYFSAATQIRTRFAVRVGQMDFDAENDPGGLFDLDLTYLTLAGEYEFAASFYRSTMFFGLGLYDVGGGPSIEDDSGLGLTVGTSGDFRINDRLSVIVQFSGHVTDLDHAQFFVMGHAGLAYHF